MYSLKVHGAMIADATRTDAYRDALRRAVRPGDVVVDIGCGSGILSFLACQAGAGRVYAIEPSEIIALAQEIGAANGLSDRIQFIAKDSLRTELPEMADVVVSDLRGALPQIGVSVAAIIDARKRFLRPSGILIPRSDTVWGALVTDSRLYENVSSPWSGECYGVDFRAARRTAANTLHTMDVRPDQLGSLPQQWCVLNYGSLENASTNGTISFQVDRPITAYGCCFWFDTILFEDVGYSSAPGRSGSVYGAGFFPWVEPVTVAAGDRVCFELRADLLGEAYVWSWKTSIRNQITSAEPGSAEFPRVVFDQSSFFAAPLRPELLRRRAADHVPVLDKEGEMDRFFLDRMDGRATFEDIARAFVARFPGQGARWEDALDRAMRLAGKYNR